MSHIYICGNLATGKTSVCKELRLLLPSYTYISIDQFREQQKDYSYQSNHKAVTDMNVLIMNTSNAIIELTGAGRNFNKFYATSMCTASKVMRVRLSAERNILLQRVKARTSITSIIHNTNSSPADSIDKIEENLNRKRFDLSFTTTNTTSRKIAKSIVAAL